MGNRWGTNGEQMGRDGNEDQFTSNLGPGWTDPITARFQVSRRDQEREQKGISKGREKAREKCQWI
jgi:hypothetical protein